MTKAELLNLMERVLQIEPGTLHEGLRLDDIPQWDSLSILNLQIELTVSHPDTDFDALRACKTVGDVYRLCL